MVIQSRSDNLETDVDYTFDFNIQNIIQLCECEESLSAKNQIRKQKREINMKNNETKNVTL